MKISKKRKQNKFTRKIKTLVLALAMIIPAAGTNLIVEAENNPGSTTSSDGLVTVNKTSERVGDNRYKINLDLATGKAQDSVEAIGNDIVLVFDISNSMAEDEHGNSTSSNDKKRLTKAKNAAIEFLNNSKISGNKKNRYSIVTFNYYGTVEQNLTSNLETAKQAIRDVELGNNSDGGTNIQAGLYKARTVLKNAKSENGIIILLSDGGATGSYKLNNERNNGYLVNDYSEATATDKALGYSGRYTFGENAINYDSVIKGGRNDFTLDLYLNNSHYSLNNAAATLAENEALLAKKSGNKIFTIGYTTGSSVNSFLKNVATQGEGYAYSSSSDLSGIYENIANEIVTRYETIIKNGIVNDPMSQYVDLLDLPDGRYDNSVADKLIFDRGYVIVSTENGRKKITWYVGDVEKNSQAHLEYYVAVKEEYKDGTDYPANDPTQLVYKNYIDKDSTLDFNVPTVNEELPITSATLTVKKVVNNSSEDKTFIIHVVGQDSENAVIYKTDLILKNNEEVLLENLPFGKYTVTETVPMEYKLESTESGYAQTNLSTGNIIELSQNKDAANGYVTLTNSFGHVGFFKATDEKTNYLPAGSETINNYEYNVSGNVKSTTVKAPQDVVLLLDKSGSMDESMNGSSRLTHLKNNVIKFITKLYEHNPDSRVSVITFAYSADGSITNNNFVKLSDIKSGNETWYTYLTKNNGGIKNIKASGGTQIDLGLYEVRNQLSSATGENNRSVIVFTDGQPGNKGFNTSYNDYDDNGYRVGAEALNQADFIKFSGNLTGINNYIESSNGSKYYGHKNDDITKNRSNNNSNDAGNRTNRSGKGLGKTIFTIGLNSNNSSLFDSFLTRLASEGHYTKANNSSAMENAFNSIFTSITTMDTDVDIRVKYDANKFEVIDAQGGKLGGSGTNAYIEWKDIIDETTGKFVIEGIKFRNIVADAGEPQLTVQGYKDGVTTDLEAAEIKKVGN